MSELNWLEIMGWDEGYLDQLRSTAFLYIRQGKYDIAKDYFHMLTVIDPEQSFDLQTLGAIYLQEDNPSLALGYLQKAKSLDPGNWTISLNYIKAMLSMGYQQESINLIEEFLRGCKDPFLRSDAEALKMAYQRPSAQ